MSRSELSALLLPNGSGRCDGAEGAKARSPVERIIKAARRSETEVQTLKLAELSHPSGKAQDEDRERVQRFGTQVAEWIHAKPGLNEGWQEM
ncbi:hypothetical protein DPX16_5657 [Anabarilius grahami]|uniref:Uncharacterized protein n=1 Tax=Anabarilius grahami TaxID=495550 RepID=A0A3N0YQ07_ANAGA|nr:hypothetical protein DPX16_5657 [Anabarilius grahami]